MSDEPIGKVAREGEYAVIRIPMERVHSLRVALQPCPCRAPKSQSTADIRAKLEKALARVQAGRAS